LADLHPADAKAQLDKIPALAGAERDPARTSEMTS